MLPLSRSVATRIVIYSLLERRVRLESLRMACGFETTKTALYIINSIYVAVAVLLIWVGAYAKSASIVTSPSIIGAIIAVGVFLILVTLLGFYGTKEHHQVALFFYMTILSILFVVQLSVTIACLSEVNHDGVAKLVTTGWTRSVNETIWDAENNFQCCGLQGTHDRAYRCDQLVCHPSCGSCLDVIGDKLSANLRLLGGIGLFFSFTELLGIWLAWRYRNLKDPKFDPNVFFRQ